MELSGQSQRWQGQRSAYSWEQSALDHIKAQMPDAEPYRAWQTFTFTTDRGHVREVDLFIVTPGGLFLVEIKSHPGTATNNGSTWMFRDGDKTRPVENPLHFTDQKAKELKSQLLKAATKLRVKEPLPRIEAVVFLSAENLKCRLDEFQRQRVYGRDKLENSTGVDGIWTGFLNQPPASERNRVTPTLSKQLPKLMQEIGIARLHRIGRVGPYELSEKSYDSGPTWEDYLATNPSLPTDYPRRVRVFLTERTGTDEDRKSVQRAAHREYLALQGISHDGIVRAEQYSDELLVGPAVVFRHGANWQRLDHFISGNPDLPLHTRLEMTDDRHHAKTQLESRRSALTATLREALRRAYGVISATDDDLGPRAAEQVLTLARDLVLRIQGGQGMRTAFDGYCGQLLVHRFPSHPDFDPNARGVALKPNELDIVLGVVEQAAQDKVGRYEVPRHDILTVKKVANPLRIGIMHESAFVLSREWPDLLTRKAGTAPEVTAAQLRGWIGEEQPGLPEQVQNLLIACYAVQADKAWLRAGRPVEPPKLDKLPDDLVLRSQELPTQEEFDTASARAAGIFRIPRQPVRTARSVHALADAIRRNAKGRAEADKDLAAELDRHAATLGLTDDADRQATSRALTALLGRLAATTDDTQTVRVLAAADLQKDNAFYHAHLDSAERLTTALRQVNWQVLEDLAAAGDDIDQALIISALRQSARHDEHEIALAAPLRKASDDAIALLRQRARKSAPSPVPVTAPPSAGPQVAVPDPAAPVFDQSPSVPPTPAGERVRARDVAALVNKICEAADEHPDAEFEINWRIVES